MFEAAANPSVNVTFLAKNGNTSFPKLSKSLMKPPCFFNCVLLNFIPTPCPDILALLILLICWEVKFARLQVNAFANLCLQK